MLKLYKQELLQKHLSIDLSSVLCPNFCTNCGEKLLQKAIYCSKCGEERKKPEYPYQKNTHPSYYQTQSIGSEQFIPTQNKETHKDRLNTLEKMILSRVKQSIHAPKDIYSDLNNIHKDEITRSIENLERNGFIKRDGLKVPILETDIGFMSRKKYFLTSKGSALF